MPNREDGRREAEQVVAADELDQFVKACAGHAIAQQVEAAAEHYKTRFSLPANKARRESLMRGLDALVANEVLPIWCVQTLACRADETPRFEHYTRAYIQRIEEQFACGPKRAKKQPAPRLVLWFAGFPMTGQIAVADRQAAGGARGSRMILETRLVWRADSVETLRQANEMLEAHAKDGEKLLKEDEAQGTSSANDARSNAWLKKWAALQQRSASDLAALPNSRFSPTGWLLSNTYDGPAPRNAARPSAARKKAARGSQAKGHVPDTGRAEDDLFIATDDGLYLLRKDEYAWRGEDGGAFPMSFCDAKFFERPATSQGAAAHVRAAMQQMDRSAELNLATQMINGGVDLAAIPSTGLPTRGTWCYLVHLPE